LLNSLLRQELGQQRKSVVCGCCENAIGTLGLYGKGHLWDIPPQEPRNRDIFDFSVWDYLGDNERQFVQLPVKVLFCVHDRTLLAGKAFCPAHGHVVLGMPSAIAGVIDKAAEKIEDFLRCCPNLNRISQEHIFHQFHMSLHHITPSLTGWLWSASGNATLCVEAVVIRYNLTKIDCY